MTLKKFANCFFLLSLFTTFNLKAQKIDTAGDLAPNFPPQANTALRYHYELPVTVLNYKTQLGLSTEQINSITKIWSTLKLKQKEVNLSTERNEHMLDSLFRTGKINEGVIIFYTNRYGLYEGEYRGAVLLACYNTHKVLTPQQLNKLIDLENHN